MIFRAADLPAEPPPSVTLVHYLVHGEADRHIRTEIGADGVIIGRTVPAGLVLADPNISRSHARIDITDGWAIVTDLRSTNGTIVNGTRIDVPTPLRTGSTLRLGPVVLKYERRDRREIEDEAELARDLRRAMDYARAILPPPLTAGPVLADWYFAPSARLGGDIFGYQFLDPDTLIGFLLDVSGHGIGSAMHAIAVGNALRQRTLPGTDLRDPAAVAAALNAHFQMDDHHGLMLTLWCWTYHVSSRVLRHTTAGHHPAILLTGGDPRTLGGRGPAIGMLPAGRWKTEETIVPPASRLYVFSDGAFDIVDRTGRRWNDETVARIIASGTAAGVTEPERLYRAAREAVDPASLPDDFSAVVLTFP